MATPEFLGNFNERWRAPMLTVYFSTLVLGSSDSDNSTEIEPSRGLKKDATQGPDIMSLWWVHIVSRSVAAGCRARWVVSPES